MNSKGWRRIKATDSKSVSPLQLQKLQDQVFCLQEERNYFQAKYLEQVSELQALREDLGKAKKEIVRLRQELMDTHTTNTMEQPKKKPLTTDKHHDDDDDEEEEDTTASCRSDEEDEDEDLHHQEDDDDDDDDDMPNLQTACSTMYEEDVQLRQSAEKLLQWARYRESTTSASSRRESMSSSSSSHDGGSNHPHHHRPKTRNPQATPNTTATSTSLLSSLSSPNDSFDNDDDDHSLEPALETEQAVPPRRLTGQVSDLSDGSFRSDDSPQQEDPPPNGSLLQRFEKVVTSL